MTKKEKKLVSLYQVKVRRARYSGQGDWQDFILVLALDDEWAGTVVTPSDSILEKTVTKLASSVAMADYECRVVSSDSDDFYHHASPPEKKPEPYVRAIVPGDVLPEAFSSPESEYSCWYIGHPSDEATSNEALNRLWGECEDAEMDELIDEGEKVEIFAEYLEHRGYTVFLSGHPGVWKPTIPTQEN